MSEKNNTTEGEVKPKRGFSKKSFAELKKVLRYVKPYNGYFFSGIAFLVISSGLTMAFPVVMGEMVKSVDGKNVAPLLDFSRSQWALLLLGVLAVQSIFSYLRVWTFAQTSQRAMSDIRFDVYRKLITLPVLYYEKNRVGEMTSRITADVEQLESVLSFTLAEFLRQIATLVIGLPIIAIFAPKLTLFMLAIFPPSVLGAVIFGRFIRKESKETRTKLADTNVIIDETLHAIQVVKSFTNELFEMMRYRKALDGVVKMGLRTANYRGGFISFIIFALMGTIAGVIWFGLGMVEAGEMLVGDLVTFVAFTAFIGGSAGGMGNTLSEIQKAMGASERVRELLGEESELEAKPLPAHGTNRLQGFIEFKNVKFSYPTRQDVEVLKDISLQVNSGQTIALAGPSGSGKSTIAQLVQRFYAVDGGQILIDGKDILDFDIREYRQNVGLVPQEVILFGGTIRENIAYGKPEATDEEIIAAATKANAMEFIDRFPEKLDTIVGDRGIRLSGGQKQRIAIARAILKDPAILILDEATSSLDAESERLVQDALNKLMKGRTTIVIAHRLSTIRDVDCIYVLENGAIRESGRHEKLAQIEGGLYHNLLKLQFDQV
ncbi:MAG: ATP-binding cassette domain-containing protein [Bacteroidia bacterium]|nr:ATP-binding cassette domain-containing protein [Bacteroidia bacterium]